MHRIPLGLVALLLLPLSSCGEPSRDLPEPATIPTTYRFDLSAFCGERSFRGDYRVTVRDGEVVAARPLDDEECYEVSHVRRLGQDRWPQA